ncbi:Gfo/Idh/MocA family oxidoreductase [Mycobacterium malmoense]|uniref:Oxidoreductase n=1 Tax=Mycobacterium malmoense TaxID=1780 RepID=A0ABX3SMT5_MYCMA|nr:Gfo/Idh/MocA family oxidoreductase [Mycobacterium malmoense]ORA79453.1 hypothetical protein BST29_19135 [Mycobacterium malmoense]QZA16799.1 Gfo/Idh/MocA family oxidoreductase [Mycobacterium malmoense]UNB93594.1 Gfo/Idh/MocA family oxidoreductase [Mycobacterium malmoense]
MIKVLLVGAGAVVEGNYLYALRRLEKADALRIVSVADPNMLRARQIAARFKQACPYPDFDSALENGSYDLALIASPPSLHADHACAALEHGCHVLCEKPMTTTAADAHRMNAAAENAGRALGVVFPRRFYSSVADVAKLVANGDLGDDLRFTYREGGAFDWPSASGAVFSRETAGGGALIDKGVHLLDQLNWIFGDPVVLSAVDDSLAGGVETNSQLELAFPNARGTLHVSWEYPLNNGLRIQGSSGEIMLECGEIRTYRRKTREGWMRVPATTTWPADLKRSGGKRRRPDFEFESIELLVIGMLRRITYGEPYLVTGVQAAGVQAVIDKAYQLTQPMACPWLAHSEEEAARAKYWRAG